MAKKVATKQADGPSVEEQIAEAYARGKADGIAMTEARFAPEPLYRRDLSELVRLLEAASVLNQSRGIVVVNLVDNPSVHTVVVPAPVFNLICGELHRFGYRS